MSAPTFQLAKFEDGLDILAKESLDEVNKAEDNFLIIQEAAVKVKRVFSQFNDSGFETTPLDILASDFMIIFRIIRREILQRYPDLQTGRRRIAARGERLPPINELTHLCVCPLTLLLRLIAKSLTRLHVSVGENPWGRIKPLRGVLVGLSQSIGPITQRVLSSDFDHKATKDARTFFPGVAQCLMFHEEFTKFTVTSSSVRYCRLVGLAQFCKHVRLHYIHSMRATCHPEVQARIEQVERDSSTLEKESDAIGKGILTSPFEREGARVPVTGQGATFDPAGHYKLACMIDYCRFVMEKPKEAQNKEKRKKKLKQRPAYGPESCAEWEFWICTLSSPGPAGPPALPRPVARREGMPKSKTNIVQEQTNRIQAGRPDPKIHSWEPPSNPWQPPVRPQRARQPMPRLPDNMEQRINYAYPAPSVSASAFDPQGRLQPFHEQSKPLSPSIDSSGLGEKKAKGDRACCLVM